MRVFTEVEQAIRDEIERDAADDYNPLTDPDVNIPCDRCNERDACAILVGVVVCDICYPAELESWRAEHITPTMIESSLHDLDDVPFD